MRPPWALDDNGDEAAVRDEKKGLAASLKDYHIVDELFRSANGAVYKARRRADRTIVVLKERRCAELGRRRDIMNEVTLLQRLRHPRVVECLGSFWDGLRGALYVVLEYARGGDLHGLLRRRRACHLPEPWIWLAFGQICEGLRHLHERGVVHRDVKSLNVLVFSELAKAETADGPLPLPDDPKLKLADLGVSRQVSDQTTHLRTMYGTPLYAAPELCEGRPYNEKADIWSLGVVLYEMAALRPPFDGCNLFTLAAAIKKGEYAPLPCDKFSDRLARCVAALLQVDGTRRPTIVDVFAFLRPDVDPAPAATIVVENHEAVPSLRKDNESPSIEAAPAEVDARRLEALLRRKRLHLQNLRAVAALHASDLDEETKLSIQRVEADIRQLVRGLQGAVDDVPSPGVRREQPRVVSREDTAEHIFQRSDRDAHKRALKARERRESLRKDILFGKPPSWLCPQPTPGTNGPPSDARDPLTSQRPHTSHGQVRSRDPIGRADCHPAATSKTEALAEAAAPNERHPPTAASPSAAAPSTHRYPHGHRPQTSCSYRPQHPASMPPAGRSVNAANSARLAQLRARARRRPPDRDCSGTRPVC